MYWFKRIKLETNLALRSAFDKEMGPSGDITTVLEPQLHFIYNLGVVLVTFSDLIVQELWHTLRQGYLRAILLCLKLKEGSLLSCGPPCGSYVFINRATSGRSKWRPFGLASIRQYVREANVKLSCKCYFICIYYIRSNSQKKKTYFFSGTSDLRITTRMVMLWFLVTVRYCFVVTEQPGTSCMTDFPYIKYFVKCLKNILGLPDWIVVRLSGAYFHFDEKSLFQDTCKS